MVENRKLMRQLSSWRFVELCGSGKDFRFISVEGQPSVSEGLSSAVCKKVNSSSVALPPQEPSLLAKCSQAAHGNS